MNLDDLETLLKELDNLNLPKESRYSVLVSQIRSQLSRLGPNRDFSGLGTDDLMSITHDVAVLSAGLTDKVKQGGTTPMGVVRLSVPLLKEMVEALNQKIKLEDMNEPKDMNESESHYMKQKKRYMGDIARSLNVIRDSLDAWQTTSSNAHFFKNPQDPVKLKIEAEINEQRNLIDSIEVADPGRKLGQS